MSRFDDRFSDHQIHQTLKDLKTNLNKASQRAQKNGGGQAALTAVRRLQSGCSYISQKLDGTDPALVSANLLNNLNQQLNQIRNYVSQYVQNGNANLLNDGHANGNMDTALQQVSQVPVPISGNEVGDLGERIKSFRRSAGQLERHLRSDVASTRKKAQALEQQVATKLEELQKQTDEFLQSVRQELGNKQQEMAQELTARLQKLDAEVEKQESRIEEQKGRIDNAIQEFQAQFSSAQETRRENFATAQKERVDSFQSQLEEHKNELESLRNQQEEEAQEHLEQMRQYEEDIRNLMEVVGATGLTGGFKEAADQEKKAANRWRGIAVISLLGIVGVAVWAVLTTTAGEPDWYGLARKVFLSGSVAILAAFAIRESGRHRMRERRNRRLQLELASIDPYLANLDEESRKTVKGKLTERWFGQPLEGEPESDDGVSAESLLEVIREALRDLTKFASRNQE